MIAQAETHIRYWRLEQQVKYSLIALKQAIMDKHENLTTFYNSYENKKLALVTAQAEKPRYETIDMVMLR